VVVAATGFVVCKNRISKKGLSTTKEIMVKTVASILNRMLNPAAFL
jgi:hypothetical protein